MFQQRRRQQQQQMLDDEHNNDNNNNGSSSSLNVGSNMQNQQQFDSPSIVSSRFSLVAHRDLYGNNKRKSYLANKRSNRPSLPYLSRSDVSSSSSISENDEYEIPGYRDAMDPPCCSSSSSSSLCGGDNESATDKGYNSDNEISSSLTRSILRNSSDNLQALVATVESSLPSSANDQSDHHRHHHHEPPTSWKDWIGYIILGILLVVGLNNTILDFVSTDLNELDDALSTEVLSPPFRSISSNHHHHNHHHNRKKSNLGTAAISSITETLTPILPFMGGADLRKEEHWDLTNEDGWLSSIYNSAYESVRDMYADIQDNSRFLSFLSTSSSDESIVSSSSQEKSATSKSSSNNNKKGEKSRSYRQKNKYVMSVSAAEPFVPLDVIADMTLSDVSVVFQYAIESNKQNFNGNKFRKEHVTSQHMRKIIDSIDSSTSISRGKDVLVSSSSSTTSKGTTSSSDYGNIDALHFCAAMRIFAEWRVLRQVPDGYKAYAVGMVLGQKDVVQNLVKIETAIHNWIEHQRYVSWANDQVDNNEDSKQEFRSPKLRDLLQYEADNDVHPNLPVLKERTAAIGLLWVRRQLDYQSAILNNVLEVPDLYKTTRDAVGAAYTHIYGMYHGWAVQKIFNYSFQAAPDGEEIFKFMNPKHLEDVVLVAAKQIIVDSINNEDDADTASICDSDAVLSNTTEDIDADTANTNRPDNDDMNPFEKLGNHIVQEWDKFGNHVGSEWNKVVSNIGGIFNRNNNDDKNKRTNNTNDRQHNKKTKYNRNKENQGLTGEDLELYIRKEMTLDARRHSVVYLDVAKPLSHDLAGLFDEFNMDDPTKV